MRVVDTSAWIEWLAGTATGRKLAGDFPARERHIVPTIIQYELAAWAGRELAEPDMERVIADSQACIVVALDTGIALRAAELKRSHRLAAADAIVYATALQCAADVLTCDAHFDGLPHVVYVPKELA